MQMEKEGFVPSFFIAILTFCEKGKISFSL